MDNMVKELSEKYNRDEVFIRNIIQMTLNKGYEINRARIIVEQYLINCL